jgi:hypothetical protein
MTLWRLFQLLVKGYIWRCGTSALGFRLGFGAVSQAFSQKPARVRKAQHGPGVFLDDGGEAAQNLEPCYAEALNILAGCPWVREVLF